MRKTFLFAILITVLLVGCATPTPQVVEKEVKVEVTKIVEKPVEVVVTATPAPEPTATPPPPAKLKIGVLIPFTGPLAEFGETFKRAADLAALHLQGAGFPVELVYADTETSAIPAVEAARKLVETDRVQVLIGAAASGVTVPVAESVSIPNNIPQISYASTSPLITVLPADQGKDFLFRTCPSDALQGVVLGKLARDQGFDTAAVMYVNNPYGQGLAEQFKKSFEARGGTVTAMVPHDEAPAPTYVSELRKAAEGNPQVLVAISYPGHATIYLREALEGGFFNQFLFVDGTKSFDIIDAVGAENLEGMLGTAPGSALSPGYDTFVGEYTKQYGEVPPLPFMTNIYDAVVVAGLAAAAADAAGKEITPVNVRDMLREVAGPPGETVGPGPEGIKKALDLIKEGKDINYEGAAGAVDFDANGDVVTPIEIWKFTGGTIQTVRLEMEIPSE